MNSKDQRKKLVGLIQLASFEYGPDTVVFTSDEKAVGILDGAETAGWELEYLVARRANNPVAATGRLFSVYEFEMLVHRQTNVLIWRIVFPLAMVMLMAWCIFWLDPRVIPAQISVGTGAVFALMTLLFTIREQLPLTAYMTIADKLVLASIILVFAAFGEGVVTGTLAQQGRLELARKIDRIGRWVYLGLVLAVLASVLSN